MPSDDQLDPDRAFALLHVPRRARTAFAALWTLDAMLGRFVAQSREPMATQIRLTWWHDALSSLLLNSVQRDPLLQELVDHVLPSGIAGAELAVLVEGWESVLGEPDADEAALLDYAGKRGSQLFELTAQLMGVQHAAGCGEGWALIDLSRRMRGSATALRAAELGADRLTSCDAHRLPRALRVLVRLARDDAAGRARTRWSYWRAVR